MQWTIPPITGKKGENGGVKCRMVAPSASLQMMSNVQRDSASAIMFCFPSMKNMQRSIPCLIWIDASDIRMEL